MGPACRSEPLALDDGEQGPVPFLELTWFFVKASLAMALAFSVTSWLWVVIGTGVICARIVADRPQAVILRMREVSHIDASGIHILEDLVKESHAGGTAVVFSAVRPHVQEVMRDSGFVDLVGGDNFADDIFAALEIAKRHLGHAVTAGKQPGSEVK